jgi:hypothetical protein
MAEVDTHKIIVGKTCNPLERKRYRRGKNIYMGHMAVPCEHMDKVDRWGSVKKSYEPSCHMMGREFLDHQVFKKDLQSL